MSWTNTPKVFPENGNDFPHYASPATLQAAPNNGSIELQHKDAAGDWVAFETIGATGVFKVDVANMPAIRLAANGDAQYQFTWKLT